MPRIKVTGYLDLDDEECDPSDESGLTQESFEQLSEEFSSLDDLRFTPVAD